MKKFWKYFLIVILALIGLMAIGLLFLFFFPGKSLFGICYISQNEKKTSKMFSATDNVINLVELNSRSYDIDVVSTDGNDVYVTVYFNSFGFVTKKHSTGSIDASLNDATLVINITEPYGACIPNNSKIIINMPKNASLNLKLNNKNALVNFDDANLKLNNLTCKTDRGELKLKQGEIFGAIVANLNRGDLRVEKAFKFHQNDVTLNTYSADFLAEDSSFGNFVVKSNNRARIKLKNCVSFNFSLKQGEQAGGSVAIDTVGMVTIVSTDTNVDINKITANGVIELTNNGKVNIGTISAVSSIKTYNGNINIVKATSSLALTTTNNGNITLVNSTASLTAKTNYGNITLAFDETTPSNKENVHVRVADLTTVSGKLSVVGADNVNLKITGSGSADVRMHDVNGVSKIEANSGYVYLQFADDAKFKLTTKSDSGSSNVNYTARDNLGLPNHEQTGEASFLINTTAENGNSLTITSKTGNIKVRDDNMALRGY